MDNRNGGKQLKTKYFLKPFELFFIILNITTYKIFTGYASILPRHSGSSAPLSALISGIIIFTIIYVLLSLCEKNGKKSVLTLAPTKIRLPIFLLLAFYLLCSSASILRFTVELIKEIAFPSAPPSYIMLIILITVVICCAQGFDAIGRLHSIIIPISVTLAIPILILSCRYGNIGNLFPFLGYGVTRTISGGLSSLSLYGDVIILFMLFPFCNHETHLKRTALISLGTGILINISVISVFTFLTPYTVSDKIAHPFLQLVKLFSAGRFLQRIDGYFLYAISGCAILSLALNFFIFSFGAKQVFSLQKTRPLSYPLALFTLFGALIFTNREYAFKINTSILLFLFTFLLLTISIVILYSYMKERKKV